MTKTILKSALFGALFGALLFFAPGLMLTMVIVSFIIKLVIRRKMRSGKFQAYRIAWADKIRSMSDEEYAQFKTNVNSRKCHAFCQTC